LHRATAGSARDQQTVARRMHERVNASLGKLLAWKVDRAALQAVSKNLVEEGVAGEFRDYAGAEQAVIALQVLLDARYDDLGPSADRAADIIFEAVDNVGSPETFDPAFIVSRFKALQPLIGAPGS
jgi:hypothetical protein